MIYYMLFYYIIMNLEVETKIKKLIAQKPNLVYKIDDKVQRYEDIVIAMRKYKFQNKLPVKYEKTAIKDVFDFHFNCTIDNLIMFDSINLDNSFIISTCSLVVTLKVFSEPSMNLILASGL